MSEEQHSPKHQHAAGPDIIEMVIRSDGTELTSSEVAALKAQFSSKSDINPFRRCICLSADYRSCLYDRLAAVHSEVFKSVEDPHLQQKIGTIMNDFLRQQLKSDNIEVNEDVFGMLFLDFIGSRDFYLRQFAQKE